MWISVFFFLFFFTISIVKSIILIEQINQIAIAGQKKKKNTQRSGEVILFTDAIYIAYLH